MINSFLSNHWRKFLFPLIFIVVLLILFIPREPFSNETSVQQFPFDIEEEKNEEPTQALVEEALMPTALFVDVQGAVTHPGVYSLMEGDRVIDAIQAAGGYVEKAESRLVNHAMKVSDEMLIYIPLVGEEAPEETAALLSAENTAPTGDGGAGDERAAVHLNTATEADLMTLTGVGPSKASAIIQYREENGPFQSIEDLMKVSGIGAKTFEALQQDITVN